MKLKYRFSHQAGGYYHWVLVRLVSPGDSRYDHITCRVGAFWGIPGLIYGTCSDERRNHRGHFYGHRFYGGRRFYCDGDVGVPLTCSDGRTCLASCGSGPCSRRCDACLRLAWLPTAPCPACPDAKGKS